MDNEDVPSSPRKKLKLHHHNPAIAPTAKMAEDSMDSDVNFPTFSQSLPPHEHRRNKEVQCGIAGYVSPMLPGFTGIIKHRFSDFQVNEIQPNGTVVRLGILETPDQRQQREATAATSKPPEPQHLLPSQETNPSEVQSSTSGRATYTTLQEHLQNTQFDLAPAFQEQDSYSDRPPAEIQSFTPTQESVALLSSPTKLNEVQQGPRIKEKVILRYGPDSISVVKEGDELQSPGSHDTTPILKQEEAAQNGAIAKKKTLGSDDIQKGASYADLAGTAGTVEGWQAFADSRAKAAQPAIDTCESEVKATQTATNDFGSDMDGTTSRTHDENANAAISAQDRAILVAYLDENTVTEILELFRQRLAHPQQEPGNFRRVTTKPIARHVRREIHEVIRRVFARKLDSIADSSGAVMITAAPPYASRGPRINAVPNQLKEKPREVSGESLWIARGGEYLHFSLYKESRETMDIVSYLAYRTNKSSREFQFAGTKDRRAVTIQRVSAYHLDAKQLIAIARGMRDGKISDLEYRTQRLQLGDLLGNEFVITLRDCHFHMDTDLEPDSKIPWASLILGNAVKKLESRGFINHYGLQRFGSFTIGTHELGRLLLQKDYKAVCEAILSFDDTALADAQQRTDQKKTISSYDVKARAYALNIYKTTGNVQDALYQLPKKFKAENCIIRYLSRGGLKDDYQGALKMIPRNLRIMYGHAYQSFVWNHAASARWREFGNKVVSGDLVLVDDFPDPSTELNSVAPEVDQDGEIVVAAQDDDRAYTADEIFARARHVTEAELASPNCKITIFDIVLPTPGHDVLYPDNSSNIYKDLMASEEGGNLDPHNMRRSWRDISLSGSYRKFLVKPRGKVQWEVRPYGSQGEDEQFVETDLQRLEKQKAQALSGQKSPEMSHSSGGRFSAQDVRSGGDPTIEVKRWGGKTRTTPESTSTTSLEMPTQTIQQQTTTDTTPATTATVTATDPPTTTTTEPPNPPNDKIAIILKMQLPSSTYATMAIRELMKDPSVKINHNSNTDSPMAY
ncbi:MAG: hypothetical protein Q9201_002104 [Fulgogasparrea decipioides]